MIIKDGSIVSVGATHFGTKDQDKKYYGVVIRLLEAGKCAWVNWNEDSTMSTENIDNMVLNGLVTSNLKQYLLQMSLQIPVTLLFDKLSLINTVLANNVAINIIIYEILESSSHILKAYSNKNIITL